MRIHLICFAFLLLVNAGFSQSKKVWIEEGDKCFGNKDYATALAWYAKVLDDTTVLKNTNVLPYNVQLVNKKFKTDSLSKVKKDTAKVVKSKVIDTSDVKQKKSRKNTLKYKSPEDYAAFQMAHTYRMLADYPNSLKKYEVCIQNAVPDARYYYALTLMNAEKYEEALKQFEQYTSSSPVNDSLVKEVQRKEAGCYLALDKANVNKTMEVAQLDTATFNKGNSSFSASYFGESTKLIFTSARIGNTVLDPKKDDGSYLCDLFLAENTNNVWSTPRNISTPVNTGEHEGAVCFHNNAIYFTRWNDIKPKEAGIYKANISGEKFFTPQKLLGLNMMGYISTHPFVTADGKKIYFSSNRPGGKGGMDIWVSDLDDNGFVGEPKNLGAPINTSGDEVTPFLHSTSGMFYFSSNGLSGFGGLDIFKSEYNSMDNSYGIPVNLNTPINSSKDDSYFVMEKSGLRGYFTSDRIDCDGGNCYKLFEYHSKPITFDISGYVYDFTTNEPIKEALVSIKNVSNDEESYFVVTDEKGYYFHELQPNTQYFVKAQKNKYFGDAASHSTKDKLETTHFEQDLFLNVIPAGEIQIEGIEYDFNSAALRPASLQSLDKIVDLLLLNDNLTVNLEANTDSRGNDAYNMKLSQSRAQSCVDYLVSKGIDKSRLNARGYGETNPIIPEKEINKLKAKSPEWEEAHQKNRRTAFKIVGESEINIIQISK